MVRLVAAESGLHHATSMRDEGALVPPKEMLLSNCKFLFKSMALSLGNSTENAAALISLSLYQ